MKERIGRYKIEVELGQGGMGAVYRAHDPMLDRQVAIKVMSPALASDQNFVQRFLLEARAVAQMQHPNIVSVYDTDLADGLYYLVMEYVSGGSLEEAIERGGLHLPQIAQIVEQVAAGLDYAHQHRMVHRDIKPNNILFDEQGIAHVADFGLVKMDQVSLTQVGQTFGTPAYMAPEQIEGQEVASYTDVYALAIVTYQMLTGQLPFDGSMVTIFDGHVRRPPPPLTKFNPTVPPALQAVVLKGMAKNPYERYASAGAFAQALRQAIQSATGGIAATGQSPSSEATIVLDKQPSQATDQSAGNAATVPQSQMAHPSDSNSLGQAHHEAQAAQSGQPPARSGTPWLKIALGAGGVLMLLCCFLIWAIGSLAEPAEPTPESAAIVNTATATVAASPTQAPEPTTQPTLPPAPTAEPTLPPEPTSAPTLAPTSTAAPTLPPEPTAEPTLPPEPTAEPTLPPEPTLAPESANQADNSAAADDYSEYTTIVDETGRLQVEAPVEWNDINSFNWFFNEQEVGPGLTASSDLEALFDDWTVPGLFFGLSESLVEQLTVEELLDNYSYAEECTESSERTEYDDGVYTGYYDLWGTCGDSDAAIVVIAASPASNAFLVLIQIQVLADRDVQAFERIVETFTVE